MRTFVRDLDYKPKPQQLPQSLLQDEGYAKPLRLLKAASKAASKPLIYLLLYLLLYFAPAALLAVARLKARKATAAPQENKRQECR